MSITVDVSVYEELKEKIPSRKMSSTINGYLKRLLDLKPDEKEIEKEQLMLQREKILTEASKLKTQIDDIDDKEKKDGTRVIRVIG